MGLADLIWNDGRLWWLVAAFFSSYALIYPSLSRVFDKIVAALFISFLVIFIISYLFGVVLLSIFFSYVVLFCVAFAFISLWVPELKEVNGVKFYFSVALFCLGVFIYLVP